MNHTEPQTGLRLTVTLTAVAGVLTGTLLGLALGRRSIREADAVLTESVEDLTRRAHRVLGELSASAEARKARFLLTDAVR